MKPPEVSDGDDAGIEPENDPSVEQQGQSLSSKTESEAKLIPGDDPYSDRVKELAPAHREVPKEYQAIGDALSDAAKIEAESGDLSRIMQTLSRVLDGVLPVTPNLERTYGLRASEIISRAANRHADAGMVVWAAARCSSTALQAHLMGCMIARKLNHGLAILLWNYIFHQRHHILDSHHGWGGSRKTGARLQAIQKWDVSIRQWLQVADSIHSRRQRRVETLTTRAGLPSGLWPRRPLEKSAIFQDGKLAFESFEDLLCSKASYGFSEVAIVALQSWHIYPDIQLARNSRHLLTLPWTETSHLRMRDYLIPRDTPCALAITPEMTSAQSTTRSYVRAIILFCICSAIAQFGGGYTTEDAEQVFENAVQFCTFYMVAFPPVLALAWLFPLLFPKQFLPVALTSAILLTNYVALMLFPSFHSATSRDSAFHLHPGEGGDLHPMRGYDQAAREVPIVALWVWLVDYSRFTGYAASTTILFLYMQAYCLLMVEIVRSDEQGERHESECTASIDMFPIRRMIGAISQMLRKPDSHTATRVSWICICGQLCDEDYTELVPRAAVQLEDQLRKTPHTATKTNVRQRSESTGTRHDLLWNKSLRRLRRLIGQPVTSPVAAGSSAKPPVRVVPERALPLPPSTVPSQPDRPGPASTNPQTTSSAQGALNMRTTSISRVVDEMQGRLRFSNKTTPLTIQSPAQKWLLMCLRPARLPLSLKQLDFGCVYADKALFRQLKAAYVSSKSPWHRWVSLTGVTTIRFVRFSIVSHFVDICPPTPDVPIKSREADYVYIRGLLPPVGEQIMTHFFHHPEHASIGFDIGRRCPKRRRRVPTSTTRPLDEEGFDWGVHLVEGVIWYRVVLLVLVLFGLGSLTFGVCWTVIKQDISGAWAVAGWFVTLGALIIAFVQFFVH